MECSKLGFCSCDQTGARIFVAVRPPCLKRQLYCALFFAGRVLTAAEGEQIEFSFSQPKPVGFADSEVELVLHVQNKGAAVIPLSLTSRLWLQSSSTVQPIGSSAALWTGSMKGAGGLDLPVKVSFPNVRAATLLQFQVTQDNGAPVVRLPLVVIPSHWFQDQLQGLPEALVVFDASAQMTPRLSALHSRFATVPDLGALKSTEAHFIALICTAETQPALEAAARELTARGRAVVLVSPGGEPGNAERFARAALADFAEMELSARAQYRFIELLRQAIRLKASTPGAQ